MSLSGHHGGRQKMLYRKVNTKTYNVHHLKGGDARHDRNTSEGIGRSMRQGIRRGLDYTPLYRFLLQSVGRDWNDVYSYALARLDSEEPIFHLVARNGHEREDSICVGEGTWYSGLYVDEENVLRRVDPDLRNEDLFPSCGCCTHTFNGEKFCNAYAGPDR